MNLENMQVFIAERPSDMSLHLQANSKLGTFCFQGPANVCKENMASFGWLFVPHDPTSQWNLIHKQLT